MLPAGARCHKKRISPGAAVGAASTNVPVGKGSLLNATRRNLEGKQRRQAFPSCLPKKFLQLLRAVLLTLEVNNMERTRQLPSVQLLASLCAGKKASAHRVSLSDCYFNAVETCGKCTPQRSEDSLEFLPSGTCRKGRKIAIN